MPRVALQQLEYSVISYLPSPSEQQPRCCSTEVRMWKNWLTRLSSVGLHRECARVKATRTKRDWLDRSPGSPIAPMPRLYVVSGASGANVFFGDSGESAM